MTILSTMKESVWNVVQRKNPRSQAGGVEYKSQYHFKSNGVVTWRSEEGSGSGSWKTSVSSGKNVISIHWNNSVTTDTWDLPINTDDWQGSAWHDGGGGFYYLYGTSLTSLTEDPAQYASNPVTTSGASNATRLINFLPGSHELNTAHVQHIKNLVSQIRGHIVDDVFIKGYADNDHAMGTARANAVTAEFLKQAPWLADLVSISSVNSKALKASSKKTDSYWRGVDVLVFLRARQPAPAPLPADSIPPMPGPRRYFDWEVYAGLGMSFQIAPGAVLAFDHYVFRRKTTGTMQCQCVSMRVGFGQSVDILSAAKALSAIKGIGVRKFIELGGQLGSSIIPASTWNFVKDILDKALGSVSLPEYSFSDAPAVTAFCPNDLNGATVFIGSASGSAGRMTKGVAGLGITQKMPEYEYKFIDTSTPPRWVLKRYYTKDLLAGVDVGGNSRGGSWTPGASVQLAGGPLILL